jgi:2-desacetyl-2-hydroxyethyl bacteriochlorophyllide A dehydrogenase
MRFIPSIVQDFTWDATAPLLDKGGLLCPNAEIKEARMKALVHTSPYKFEMQDYDVPSIAESEVLLQVKAVGICGSDVHGMSGKTGRRQTPIVMGHEAAGLIVEKGAAVEGFEKGDRVTFDSTIYCNNCRFCYSGRANLCDNRKVLGVSCDEYRLDGAMAEFVAVPSWILTKIPDNMSFAQAAMAEPVSIAYHGVERADIEMNDLVAVVGSGMIGLLTIQVARLTACGTIAAIDIDDRKLKMARELGADIVINSANQDPLEVLLREAGRGEVDVCLDAVGLPSSINTALSVVRKGGTLVLIGNWAPEIPLALQVVVMREIDLKGSAASNRDFDASVDLIASGRVKVDSLISKVVPLEEGPEWFHVLHEGKQPLFKVILEP